MSAAAEERKTTVDERETEKFARMAEEWWDPTGKFRPLHKFNPVRLRFIHDEISTRFDRNAQARRPFEGLRFLDIGCGGGLLSEPMTRLGADVVGVDATARNVEVAKLHAEQQGLEIDYRVSTAEDLAAAGETFDVILNMEVVEHVADVKHFLTSCADMLRPGGVMIIATINRTPKALAMAIFGAEYVLRWLPRGTHQYEKLVKPIEIRESLLPAGLDVEPPIGVSYSPLADRWALSRDTAVNYMVVATRAQNAQNAPSAPGGPSGETPSSPETTGSP